VGGASFPTEVMVSSEQLLGWLWHTERRGREGGISDFFKKKCLVTDINV
jgi:hypothetical protein